MAQKKKYVYFDVRPTNVCWNGVSFPLMPGDVMVCTPEFIAAYIPESKYKEVPAGSAKDRQAVRHTFGKQPQILRPDPTKGLPITSTPGPKATKLASQVDLSSSAVKDLQGEKVEPNPYALEAGDEATLDMGTSLDSPSAPEPKTTSMSTAPPGEHVPPPDTRDPLLEIEKELIPEDELEAEEEDIPEDNLEEPEAVEDETEEESGEEEVETGYPSRTDLRKFKVDELVACCEQFDVPVPEKATRGPLIDALFTAFGYKTK